MPHLQFELNKKISKEKKKKFSKTIMSIFAEVMDTKTDHIAISIREYKKNTLFLGRADTKDDICLMNLDIREGRSLEQRRELVLSFMEIVKKSFQIETKNQYVTITEHKGEDFHLVEKYLSSWEIGEDPLA